MAFLHVGIFDSLWFLSVMLLFVDGCSARLDSARLTAAHCEGYRRSGDNIG